MFVSHRYNISACKYMYCDIDVDALLLPIAFAEAIGGGIENRE